MNLRHSTVARGRLTKRRPAFKVETADRESADYQERPPKV